MKINKVHLDNYRVHEKLDIEFVKGINLLLGSNGKGKSSILEAIGYALFESDMRRKNQKEAIKIGTSRAKIQVEFTGIDEIDYVVEKLIPGGTKFYKKGSEPDPSINDKNRVETIKRLCGVKGDLKGIYDNVIIAKQNEFINAFKESDAKREEIFNKIFNTEIYKKIFDGYGKDVYDHYRGLITVDEATLKEKESTIEDPVLIKEKLSQFVKEKEELSKELEKKDIEYKKLNKEIENYNKISNEIEKNNIQINSFEAYIKSKGTEKEKSELRLRESEASKEILKINQESHDKYMEIYKKISPQKIILEEENIKKDKFDKIETYIEKIKNKKEETQSLAMEIENEKKENYQEKLNYFEKLEKERENVRGQIEKYASLIESNRESLEKLREYMCPYLQEPCKNIENKNISQLFQKKEDIYLEEQNKLKLKLDEIIKELKEREIYKEKSILLKDKIETHMENNRKLEQGMAQVEKEILRLPESEVYKATTNPEEIIKKFVLEKDKFEGSLKEKSAEIKEMESVLAKLNGNYLVYIENLKKSKEIDSIKEEIKKIDEEIKGKLESVAKIKETLEMLKESQEKIEIMEIKNMSQEINLLIQELNKKNGELDANIKNATEKIKEIENNMELIEEKKKALEKLNKKLEMTGIFRERVKSMGKEMTKSILEEVEVEATENFRRITGTGDIVSWSNEDNNKYLVKIKREDGEIRFDQLSGGEQVAVAISIRGAMSTIFTESKFSIFDEPTNNLDQERRKSLAESIGEILKNLDQSIIVTHDDTFREMAEKVIEL